MKKKFIEPEPNWKGSAVNLNYDCTLAFFAKQIGIKLWQAMAMMKYAETNEDIQEIVDTTEELVKKIKGGQKGGYYDTRNTMRNK